MPPPQHAAAARSSSTGGKEGGEEGGRPAALRWEPAPPRCTQLAWERRAGADVRAPGRAAPPVRYPAPHRPSLTLSAGVPHSHVKPYVRAKGRKFEKARGKRASRGYKA